MNIINNLNVSNRICNDKKQEKISFKKRKENIICSLNEVENFLCQVKKISKGLKIYNIMKY